MKTIKVLFEDLWNNSWEYDDDVIRLDRNNMNKDEYMEAIIHELIHCILDKYYYVNTSNPIINNKIEEQLVNILSNEIANNRKNIKSIHKEIKSI